MVKYHWRSEKKCSVEGCEGTVDAHGYCAKHRKRFQKYGDPLAGSKFYAADGEPARFLAKAKRYRGNECLIWPYYRDDKGYARIGDGAGKKAIRVARIICEAEVGPPPSPEFEASHTCGNGYLGCVTPRHLVWETHAENLERKIEHGTILRGTFISNSKLTEAKVRKVRKLKDRFTHKEIGERFGVSAATIDDILAGRTWKWLL